MSDRLVIHDVRLLDADQDVEGGWIVARSGSVVAAGSDPRGWVSLAQNASQVVDGAGLVLVPGFIDLHGHGGAGASFEDSAEEIARALALHRAHGTTRSVLSLVSNPLPRLRESLGRIAELARHDETVLGAHLEGPFLAPGRRGAHEPDTLIAPDPAAVDSLLDAAAGQLRQLTIAPELPGAMAAIPRLVDAGVVVAVGHTEADHDTALTAFDAGATLLTHAFNAMAGLGHRDPGPVGAALGSPSVVLELIADGVHVHPRMLRLAFGAAAGRVALITDAMAAAGAADGSYRLGSLDVSVTSGRAVLSGTDTIAGSTLTQDAALRFAVTSVGVSPVEAVAALTSTPARVLGLGDRFGRLAPGYAADLVLLDHEWRTRHVWQAGVPR